MCRKRDVLNTSSPRHPGNQLCTPKGPEKVSAKITPLDSRHSVPLKLHSVTNVGVPTRPRRLQAPEKRAFCNAQWGCSGRGGKETHSNSPIKSSSPSKNLLAFQEVGRGRSGYPKVPPLGTSQGPCWREPNNCTAQFPAYQISFALQQHPVFCIWTAHLCAQSTACLCVSTRLSLQPSQSVLQLA